MKKSEYYLIVCGLAVIIGNQQAVGSVMKVAFNYLVIYLAIKAIYHQSKEESNK